MQRASDFKVHPPITVLPIECLKPTDAFAARLFVEIKPGQP
jgi:hypothetical protein